MLQRDRGRKARVAGLCREREALPVRLLKELSDDQP
jgi:hypothetical protein